MRSSACNVDGRGACGGAGLAVHHLDGLRAQRAAQDRCVAGTQRGLVDVELVRIHRALHDGLAEPVGSGDEDDVAEAGVRVEREHDAARAEIGAHHVLDARRQRDLVVREALMHAIGDRAIVEQRGEHFVHALEQRVAAAHVEERFLLTGERCVRQVLGRRRGAHGDGDVAPAAHALEGFEDLALELRRKRRRQNPAGGSARRRS